MYCANCGSTVKTELNYCNRCGAKVFRADLETQKATSENLTASLGYIGGFGLIGFIFVALVLVKNHVPPVALVFISLFYLAALFGICFLIIQQVRNISGNSSPEKVDFQSDFQTGQLDAAHAAQLEEPRQQPISVTEHTTRTLDKIESKF